MSNDNLRDLVRELIDIENDIQARKIVAETVRNQIKQEMEERNLEELEVDEHIVRYKDILTSVFDKTAFKKKYEELYLLYLKQIPSKRFIIN